MTIDELSNPAFASFKELQQFSAAQAGLINNLNKKINQLESEKASLQNILEKNTPVLLESDGKLEVYQNIPDEMVICLMQIKLLREKCMGGAVELTHEEAKKLDVYTKLLISMKKKDSEKDKPEEKLTDEEFQKILEETIGK